MKRIHHNILSLSALGLLITILFCWGQPLLADVDAQLSRNTTSLEEPVRLQLQITGENDASPDLSVLQQDFEILGRSSQQNISIINGQMSKSQGLTLTLLPRKNRTINHPAYSRRTGIFYTFDPASGRNHAKQ